MHMNGPKGVPSRPSQYFNYVKGTERSTELTQELGGAATTIPASALHSFQSEGACGFSDLRSWKPIDSAVFNAMPLGMASMLVSTPGIVQIAY